MPAKSLQSKGSGDAGTFSDLVPPGTVHLLSCSQAPPPPVMCFPTLSTTGPLGFEDSTAHQLRLTCGGTSSGRSLEPAPCRLVHAPGSENTGGPTWHGRCSPWEDGGQSALGPGSRLWRAELTEVYLFIICLGRNGRESNPVGCFSSSRWKESHVCFSLKNPSHCDPGPSVGFRQTMPSFLPVPARLSALGPVGLPLPA